MLRNNFTIFLLANCIVEAFILIFYGRVTISNIFIAFVIALMETLLYLVYVFIGKRRHRGIILVVLIIIAIIAVLIFQETIKNTFRGGFIESLAWLLRLVIQTIAFMIGVFY